jgi:hypothetical protein
MSPSSNNLGFRFHNSAVYVLEGSLSGVICMARSLQVLLIEEESIVAAALLDVDLCSDNVVDVSAWRVATADITNLAQWIAAQDLRTNTIAPVSSVVEPANPGRASVTFAIAIGMQLNIGFLMIFTVATVDSATAARLPTDGWRLEWHLAASGCS